jgi:T6SS, Transcription factor, DNA binding domain
MPRPKPSLDPQLADAPPVSDELTDYDYSVLVVYLRLLDAAEEGADWREVARIVLKRDPDKEPERAKRAYDTHLARARWMTEHGYQDLLRQAGSE